MHFQGVYDLILILFDLGLFGWELWTVERLWSGGVGFMSNTHSFVYLYFGTSLFLDKQVHTLMEKNLVGRS